MVLNTGAISSYISWTHDPEVPFTLNKESNQGILVENEFCTKTACTEVKT